MSKRVWKPVDIGGLRLYEVTQTFPNRPNWKRDFVVAAHSPSEAARIVEASYEGAMFKDGIQPNYRGYALNVCQPAEWAEEGIPCFYDWRCDQRCAEKTGGRGDTRTTARH